LKRADDLFTIEIPEYLSPVSDLHPMAQLQYADPEGEKFSIYVLTDVKENLKDLGVQFSREELYLLYTEQIISHLKNGKISKPQQDNIEYMSSLRGFVLGIENGMNMRYDIVVSEGPQRFYTIVTKCQTDKYKNLREDIERTVHSLKEVREFKVQTKEEQQKN
jgi:hypothetical protein